MDSHHTNVHLFEENRTSNYGPAKAHATTKKANTVHITCTLSPSTTRQREGTTTRHHNKAKGRHHNKAKGRTTTRHHNKAKGRQDNKAPQQGKGKARQRTERKMIYGHVPSLPQLIGTG